MRKITLFALAVVLMLAGTLNLAYAEDNEVMLLKSQIENLNKKLASLETKVSKVESAAPSYAAPVVASSEGGLLHAMQDITMSGYLDVQYNLNMSSSGTPAGGNVGRIFDNDRRSFTVNSAELDFAREANPEGGAGFRLDLMMGEDADVVNADGSGDSSKVDLQQAYAEYVAPLGFFEGSSVMPQSIKFMAGRFVTLAGLEVIEAKDNWNISRSFAFGYAIPFAHTGVRSNFKMFNEKLDVYAGVNNGWGVAVDNNTYKTMEFGLGYSPLENVSLFHSIYWGPEIAGTNAHKRFLSSNVISWNATDKLAFKGEFNFGDQRRSVTNALENVEWYSYAGYSRYQFNDKLALAYRAELMQDNKRFATGLDHTIWEQTLTLERKLSDSMVARLEYRYDKGNDLDAFNGSSNQQTIGAQILYLI